jgi:GTP-binding protein
MQATFLKSLTKLEDLPSGDKPQVAFVGRSNVGKSSLINHLTSTKNLARVSRSPGRTQTINLFDIDGQFFLVDLPGYGYAKASKEKQDDLFQIVDTYLREAEQLKLVFLIIDARLGPTELDRDMLEFLLSSGVSFVMILNKIDKLSRAERIKLASSLKTTYPGIELIEHSSVRKIGRGEILDAMQRRMRGDMK